MTDITPDAYSRSLGKEVAVDSVDKELRQLWEEDKASTNASLINLAVYSEADGAILKNSEIVQAITREHACRALLIGIDRGAQETSIRAWITAHCHLSQQGKKSVCCEQVAFQLTGRATGRLRNTVFSHLSSDLPLVFWWQGELSPIFSERLYSLIDRFVFDSSDWAEPEESFRRISRVFEESGELAPMDLEWTRSYPLRLAIAGLFDDPLAQQGLEQTSSVRIVVHPGHRAAGLQVLAWLIHSTGWRRGECRGLDTSTGGGNKADRFCFQTHSGTAVTAAVEYDPAGAPIGCVELSGPDCVVRVLREPGAASMHQQLEAGNHRIDRLIPSASDEASELVADQLARGGKNTLYRSILPLFYEFLSGGEEV